MSETITTVNPVAKLYRDSYTLGVEHHSTSKMPTTYDDFEKAYPIDTEFIVPIKELYSVYRKGYRAGAPVIISPVTKEDIASLGYVEKLNYIKADPRFVYTSGSGFVFKGITHSTIDSAYMYTKQYFENGGDNV